MNEQWRDVVGYEGLYQVSNSGRVRGVRFGVRERKVLTCTQGYQRVGLSKDGVNRKHRVHRLVAQAFIDGQLPGYEVNHVNGDVSDNNVLNLEWCSKSQNAIHAFENDLSRKGDRHRWAKKWYVTTPEGVTAKFTGLTELCKVFDLNSSSLSRVALGKNSHHHGWTIREATQ